MKVVFTLSLLFLCSTNALAQQASGSSALPELKVFQNSWYQAIPSEKLHESADKAIRDQTQARVDLTDPEIIRTQLPKSSELNPDAGNLFQTYVYELKVKNTGRKAIQKVTWEYVFIDSDTEKEAGRRLFVSKENISPGKTRKLIVRTTLPPLKSNNASKTGEKSSIGKSGEVIIRSIEYSDGSVWLANS